MTDVGSCGGPASLAMQEDGTLVVQPRPPEDIANTVETEFFDLNWSRDTRIS